MSDYIPLHLGEAITRTASAAVTGGQVVVVSGEGTVAPAGATSTAWLGVAAFDAAAGEDVTVHKGGVQRPVASGAVAAGAMVATAATGKVATAATPTVGQLVGVALSAAADGETVDVDFVR